MGDWVRNDPDRELASNSVLIALSPQELSAYGIKREEVTGFLELPTSAGVNERAWPKSTVVVGLTNDESFEKRLPHYLRAYWFQKILPQVERYASAPESGNQALRVVYISGSGAAADDRYHQVVGFNSERRTIGVEWAAGKISVQVEEAAVGWRADGLGLTREMCLRELFFSPGIETTITVGEAIKPGKVYLVVAAACGTSEAYVVKFDYPKMIDHEYKMRELMSTWTAHTSPKVLYEVYNKSSIEGDILGVIASRSLAHAGKRARSPRKLADALRGELDDHALEQIIDGVKGVLKLFTDAAKVLAGPGTHCKLKYATLGEFFAAYLRALPGFARILDLEGGESLDQYVSAQRVDDREWIEYGVRRVLVDKERLAIEFDFPKRSAQGRLRVQRKLGNTNWCLELESSKLMYSSRAWVRSRPKSTVRNRPTKPVREPWTRAGEKLRAYVIEGVETAPTFKVANIELPNPVWHVKNLLERRNDGVYGKEKHQTIVAPIHFDLKLDNIVAIDLTEKLNQDLAFEVIDLASMTTGPIDCDLARLEVYLLLDSFTQQHRVIENKDEMFSRTSAFFEISGVKLPEAAGGQSRKDQQMLRILASIREARKTEVGEVLNCMPSGPITTFDKLDPLYWFCRFAEATSEIFTRANRDKSDAEILAGFYYAALSLGKIQSLFA